MFVPRSEGKFTQYWDLQCYLHPSVHDNSMTVRISLVGEASRKKEEKSRDRDSSVSTASDKNKDIIDRPVSLKDTVVTFDCVEGVKGTAIKIAFENASDNICGVKVVPPQPPFYIKHHHFNIGKRRFLKYPIEFKPDRVGTYEGIIVFKTDLGYSLSVQLHGNCKPESS
ncbi:hypothetical protein SNE40_008061 [Patella caerulea]|uniref:Uncharacterized protein n=1 Tax=Patella caerulea TaxID=87958 RepID=A0AAN8K147_PATCE